MEQTIGLALALSSSIFIGASFIIKKRGLRIAGSTGIRAGERARVCCARARTYVPGTFRTFKRPLQLVLSYHIASLFSPKACELPSSTRTMHWCQAHARRGQHAGPTC